MFHRGTFVKKSCPCLGSNQGPSACKADVITATLQGHLFTRSSTREIKYTSGSRAMLWTALC
ncbi:hypothetical protein T07_11773 [Trichinella nelsoni]|uniref:Uncharacterized protein n=1 Tax=Trichinella nelsoni TaxID=6336 RepID=A0A0V0SF59_9BILA|nr:hypothetical protein T07_11773 [Trichinella nelsoni]